MVLPGFFDLIDITLVAAIAWLAYRSLQRTRLRNAVAGLAVFPALFLVAGALELRMMATLLQGFFAVAVLLLVVVFQEDLRRFFEDIGNWRRERGVTPPVEADVLIRSVARLAANRTGALIVVPGRDDLTRHLTGGVVLDGQLSEPLLLSIFDASSPGHDGACLIRGARVERFAAHLPLSSNHAELGPGGTRHAAALGLSERCDATVIVVSEERGTVSIARNGTLRTLDRAEALVDELAIDATSDPEPLPLHRRRVAREGVLAITAATALWMFLVPGAEIVEAELPAKIEAANLPPDVRLVASDPVEATVVLRGARRDVLLAERSGLAVRIDAYLARLGRRTFTLESSQVHGIGGASVVSIRPERVRLDLAPADAPANTDEPEPAPR